MIARWTEANYTLIVGAVSLFSLFWVWLSFTQPNLINRISTRLLVVWNLLFAASLTLTLLAQRVTFPPTLDSPPVVVGGPTILQMIPLVLMLLLFPVLFLDLQVFIQKMQLSTLPPRSLAPGIILGSFSLIVLIFINIFSNVWGYIKPISPPFRNTFWLAYFLLSAGITLLAWRARRNLPASEEQSESTHPWQWAVILLGVFLVTLIYAVPTPRVQTGAAGKTSAADDDEYTGVQR